MMTEACDISGKSVKEIINMDAKKYVIEAKNYTYKIGVVNVVEYDNIMNKTNEYLDEMEKEIKQDGYVIFLFCLTHIIDLDSKCMVSGDKKSAVKDAFGTDIENNVVFLKGRVARKKDIQPPLNTALEKL